MGYALTITPLPWRFFKTHNEACQLRRQNHVLCFNDEGVFQVAADTGVKFQKCSNCVYDHRDANVFLTSQGARKPCYKTLSLYFIKHKFLHKLCFSYHLLLIELRVQYVYLRCWLKTNKQTNNSFSQNVGTNTFKIVD